MKKKNLQTLSDFKGPFFFFFLQTDALNETVALELSYTDIKLFSKHGHTHHAENIRQSCS